MREFEYSSDTFATSLCMYCTTVGLHEYYYDYDYFLPTTRKQ